MFKFIKPKGPNVSADRQKLQKELFAYRRTLQHGFPHKPTALAWDPTLRLLAIGTASGVVKIFGKPGVEFYGNQHQAPQCPIIQLCFVPNVGKLVSLSEDNTLHLWEVDKSALVASRKQQLEGKLKRISKLCVNQNKLLLGTEGGNIYLLELGSFSMTPDIIYQDVVLQSAPPEFKFNPGAVEAIAVHPTKPEQIIFGYNRGLIVLWNTQSSSVIRVYTPAQQLESLCWHPYGDHFTSSHNDGSYISWSAAPEDDNSPIDGTPNTVYGPFACKATVKLIRKELNDKPLIVFGGGLPRSNYGEKYSVTVMHDERHVVFDFTSKVLDFVIVDANSSLHASDQEIDDPESTKCNISSDSLTNASPLALIVLTEEELVAIDLLCDDWKMMNLPYMASMHASAVTCSHYVSGIPEDLWEKLRKAGEKSNPQYSTNPWPIDGGALLCSKGQECRRELLLTGHEDGSVRFWNAGGVTLTPLYKFSTSSFFTVSKETHGEDVDDSEQCVEDVDDWPPFRKTGIFDPYSDDPRLAVKRVTLCPLSGTLVVAGTAGHIVIAKFDTEVLEGEVKLSTMNIVSDRDGFVWKGHSELTHRKGYIFQARGFQAVSILQVYPPAAITCCVIQSDWGLVAAGTAHGLALFDYIRYKPVVVKCTLNPSDLSGAGDAPISRRKSFKKSLRESFRRLRKGRSQRRTDTHPDNRNSSEGVSSPPVRKPPIQDESRSFNPLEAKPVERQIEARPSEDAMGSFVRCLYFARTFLISVQNTVPTLWAGTNNGTVFVFTICVPNATKRLNDDVTCKLGKEIQLKHRAPVIAIAVLDGNNRPLPEALEVERGVAPLPDTTQAHRVIIASEEQFKIFSLPNLKPFCKYKLTAHEGARIRRMNFANFSCSTLDNEAKTHTEIDLLCLTNLGDCLVLSIPDLKRQLNAAAVKKEDINGISSLIFTRDGEALYMHSSSELQRLSLSTSCVTIARCYLSVPEGCKDKCDKDGQDNDEQQCDESAKGEVDLHQTAGGHLSNGFDGSATEKENGDVSCLNSTVTSSIGDITIDSVKDHLQTTAPSCTEIQNNITAEEPSSSNTEIASGLKTETISSEQTNDVSSVPELAVGSVSEG